MSFRSETQSCAGFCIAKTAQALMVGIYDDKIQAGNCNTVPSPPSIASCLHACLTPLLGG
jgi:hypothetical protein